MALFDDMVQDMHRMEFFQYLFPFLLSFALLYGLMQWVFKEGLGGKRVHTLIAIIISFFVMLYSSLNTWLYYFLTNISGMWLGIGTVLLLLVLATELLGLNIRTMFKEEKSKWLRYGILLVVLYIIFAAFLGAGSMGGLIPYWVTGSDLWTVVLVIIIIAIVFAFIGGEEKAAPAAEEGGKKE
jgi:hypothetical protein